MDILTSLPLTTKNAIITGVLTATTNMNLTTEDVKLGLREMESKIDELLISTLKTFIGDMRQRAIKLAILANFFGAEIVRNEEMIKLLYTEPSKSDQAMLLALVLLSNKDKVFQTII